MPREFMPIMGFADIRLPWALIAPHEAQAQENHGQTLERLAERGGLDPVEAYAVLTDRHYREFQTSSGAVLRCRRALIELIDTSGVAPAEAQSRARCEFCRQEVLKGAQCWNIGHSLNCERAAGVKTVAGGQR